MVIIAPGGGGSSKRYVLCSPVCLFMERGGDGEGLFLLTAKASNGVHHDF